MIYCQPTYVTRSVSVWPTTRPHASRLVRAAHQYKTKPQINHHSIPLSSSPNCGSENASAAKQWRRCLLPRRHPYPPLPAASPLRLLARHSCPSASVVWRRRGSLDWRRRRSQWSVARRRRSRWRRGSRSWRRSGPWRRNSWRRRWSTSRGSFSCSALSARRARSSRTASSAACARGYIAPPVHYCMSFVDGVVDFIWEISIKTNR